MEIPTIITLTKQGADDDDSKKADNLISHDEAYW
jgi:hypothetical protein